MSNTIKIKIIKKSDSPLNWFDSLVGNIVEVSSVIGEIYGRKYYMTTEGRYRAIWKDCAEEVFEMEQWLQDTPTASGEEKNMRF